MKRRVLGALLLVIGAVTGVMSSPAAAAAQLTVTPATGLIDLQAVQVEATGFRPGALVGACQTIVGAASSDDCASETLVWGPSSATGTMSLTVTVRRFVYIPSLDRTVDCTDPAERCAIAAAEAFDIAATIVDLPIAFAPALPPPPTRGSITVSPDEGLIHGEVVAVEGTGFRPDVDVVIGQCVPEPRSSGDCSRWEGTVARTDDAGSFSSTHRLRRAFYLPEGGPIVDCVSSPCTIAVSERLDFPGTVVTAPLGFEPPSGEPAISVTPDQDLRPGDVVTVSGVDFVPNEAVQASSCSDTSCWRYATTVVGEDGSFSVRLTMFDPGDACRAATSSCHVRVQQWEPFFLSVEAPIAFAPPDPPPPVVAPGGATVVEGDGPTTTLQMPVTLSAPSNRTVTVEWATVHDPAWGDVAAVPGLDYAPASAVVTFAPGATEATATVTVTGDEVPEGDELLVVSFRNPTNARMGGFWGLGFGGIADDD